MNNLLKIFLLLFCGLWLGTAAQAQKRGDEEQIKALKIAFFTERLNLNSEEAAVFWPLYNEHQAQKEALRKEQRESLDAQFEKLDAVTESEARKTLDRYLELEEREEEIDKAFFQKISREFSAVRTLELFRAERDFRRRLLQEYRKRRGQR